MNNDFDPLAGTVNPDPYPQYGSPDAQRAWWDKDRELKRGRKSAPTTAPQIAKDVRGDGFDLPLMPPPIGGYPQHGTYDERFLWVQRASVACADAGVTEHNRAIELEWLRLVEEHRQNRIIELTNENNDLTMRLNKAERTYIDAAADKLQEAARALIVEEFQRQMGALEKRVLAVSLKSVGPDEPDLNLLNAKLVVLMQRCSELERLNPSWVSIHTGQRV
jgi:hypothetical protein